MPDLNRMLDEVARRSHEGLTFRRTKQGLRASTIRDRSQAVSVDVRGDAVRMTSPVAAKSWVPERGEARATFIRRLWEINAHTDLVAFGIDSYGRVVGTCSHPLATLDQSELEVYLVALVHECDRLEWVLTGEDRY